MHSNIISPVLLFIEKFRILYLQCDEHSFYENDNQASMEPSGQTRVVPAYSRWFFCGLTRMKSRNNSMLNRRALTMVTNLVNGYFQLARTFLEF